MPGKETSRVRSRILVELRESEWLPQLQPIVHEVAAAAAFRPAPQKTTMLDVIACNRDIELRLEKILNSAYYNYRFTPGREVAIGDAFDDLGPSTLRDIVTSLAICDTFKEYTDSHFSLREFWYHGIAVGIVAQIIVRFSPVALPVTSSLTFQCGLCHDIGKLLGTRLFPQELTDALGLAQERQMMLYEAELELLKVHHGEIGYELLNSWRVQRAVCVSALYHHAPELAIGDEMQVVINAIQLADYVCNHQDLGFSGNERSLSFPRDSFTALNLDVDDIPKIIDKVRENRVHIDVFIDVAMPWLAK